MNFYEKKYLTNYRGVMPDDFNDWQEFLGKIRTIGLDEATNIHFPKKWHWVGENIGEELIGDLISGTSGLFLSQKASRILGETLGFRSNASFEIDGFNITWSYIKQAINEDEISNTESDILVVRPSYKTIFSSNFVEVWLDNNLQGCEFVPYIQHH